MTNTGRDRVGKTGNVKTGSAKTGNAETGMTATEVHDVARRLMAAKGDRAIMEAMRRASESVEAGMPSVAQDWRRVADAIALLRGPRAT